MLDQKQLDTMRNLKITEIDPAALIDMDTIKIDNTLHVTKRIESYLEQVKNPYCFLCGDISIRVRFVSDKKTLAQSLGDYFISLK